MSDLIKELEALVPLAENASPDLWEIEESDLGNISIDAIDGHVVCARILQMDGLDIEAERNDAAFIAAARNFLTPDNLKTIAAALAPSASSVVGSEGGAASLAVPVGGGAAVPAQYELSIRAMKALFKDWGLADCAATLEYLLNRPAGTAASGSGEGAPTMAEMRQGLFLNQAQVAISKLLDTLEYVLPKVPKVRLNGDDWEGIYAAQGDGRRMYARLKDKVDALENRIQAAAPLSQKGDSQPNIS